MAALDIDDWTVTVTERWIEGKKRHSKGTLVLAGTDTYPTGGVPLPTAQTFGLVRNLDELRLTGQRSPTITGYVEKVDYPNNKLLLYVSHDTAGVTTLPMDEEDTAGVPGARTWDFVAVGW